MEVHSQILELLKCSLCKGYLSYSPILMLPNGDSMCGRCVIPEGQSVKRVSPYELLALQMVFPCHYKPLGCLYTCQFIHMAEHENACKYRQTVCFVTTDDSCQWIGPVRSVFQHCAEEHPHRLLPNKSNIQHDFSAQNSRAFVLAMYDMIFLVYIEVSLQYGKVYHSVQMFYHPDQGEFQYELTIRSKNKSFTITDKVDTLQSCLKQNSYVVTMGELLKEFGSLGDILFNINIKKVAHQCKRVYSSQHFKLGHLYRETK